MRWGQYFDALGDLRMAERWYRVAVTTQPVALVFLGGVLAKRGRLSDAKRSHRRATLRPEAARDEAYYNLALILRAERQYSKALTAFDHALALDPDYTIARDDRADVESAMTIRAPDDCKPHWRLLLDNFGERPATAHELARTYVRRYPEDFGGWILLADTLAGFARYADAVEAHRKAERAARAARWRESPDHFLATQWGGFYRTKKDYRRAEFAFRRALKARVSVSTLTNLGEVLVLQGRFPQAWKYLQKAIGIDSTESGGAHYQLALIARARRQYAEALTYSRAAIRTGHEKAREVRRDVLIAARVRH